LPVSNQSIDLFKGKSGDPQYAAPRKRWLYAPTRSFEQRGSNQMLELTYGAAKSSMSYSEQISRSPKTTAIIRSHCKTKVLHVDAVLIN
jgi:hypothetical protein